MGLIQITNFQVLPGLILLQKLYNFDVPIWRKVEQAREDCSLGNLKRTRTIRYNDRSTHLIYLVAEN